MGTMENKRERSSRPQTMMRVALSRQELEPFAADLIGFGDLDLARFSTIFLAQLAQLHVNRSVNIYAILDEIRYLEGAMHQTCAGPASTFKHEPLRGLEKKHFVDARFVPGNLIAHFGAKFGGNARREAVVDRAFQGNTSGYVDEKFLNELTYDLVVSAYEDRARAKRLTGEWIVFQKYRGKNYYLTVAAHDEGDDRIYRRVRDCYDMDFDFLTSAIKPQAN